MHIFAGITENSGESVRKPKNISAVTPRLPNRLKNSPNFQIMFLIVEKNCTKPLELFIFLCYNIVNKPIITLYAGFQQEIILTVVKY